ncbi:MAG: hypothetical protein IPK16_10465 [Anaerolineales bacterium]|nr:hypothetical protein [Anaerolineales bacterium]
MIWYFVYCFPLVVAAITSIFLITIIVPRRSALGAKALISMLIAVAIWEVAYALEIYSPTLDEKIFFAKVEYIGIAAVVPAWLVFTVLYTHQDRWIIRNPIGIVLMSAIPVLSLILVWTNEAHGLIWSTTELDTTTPIPMLAVTHGVGLLALSCE